MVSQYKKYNPTICDININTFIYVFNLFFVNLFPIHSLQHLFYFFHLYFLMNFVSILLSYVRYFGNLIMFFLICLCLRVICGFLLYVCGVTLIAVFSRLGSSGCQCGGVGGNVSICDFSILLF